MKFDSSSLCDILSLKTCRFLDKSKAAVRLTRKAKGLQRKAAWLPKETVTNSEVTIRAVPSAKERFFYLQMEGKAMNKINIATRDLEDPALSSSSTAEILARLNLVKEDLDRLSFAVEADVDLQRSPTEPQNGPHASGFSADVPAKTHQTPAPREISALTSVLKKGSSLVFNLNRPDIDMKMLASEDLSDILAISRSTVYRLARKGVLKSHRIGRRLRFDLEEVMSFLESRAS